VNPLDSTDANPLPEYSAHWDEKFRARPWGRYPPEDLVRFMGRNFRELGRRRETKVLEIGCGPGANLWFLHREGFRVAGIDGSTSAIDQACARLRTENAGLNPIVADLRVGDLSRLPWAEAEFDVVVDNFALYANLNPVIERAISEVYRVLKPDGRFYLKVWGRGTTGYGEGRCLEEGTYTEIPRGPCRDMGVAHFFDEAEIRSRFARFQIDGIDRLVRSDSHSVSIIEELACQFTKLKVD
jgi:SAM-dependent methyltransferase